MEIENGSLIIGHWHETPIRINWTILLTPIFFGRFEFLPFFWIAFFALVFIHEAGHVFIIRIYNLWIDEIVIHGLGGYCRWVGDVSEIKRALIAWGGVIAQLLLLFAALLAIFIFGPPKSSYSSQIFHVFIQTNMWMVFFNLIPIEPLDGAKAWRIIDPIRGFISSKFTEMKHQRQVSMIALMEPPMIGVMAPVQNHQNTVSDGLLK